MPMRLNLPPGTTYVAGNRSVKLNLPEATPVAATQSAQPLNLPGRVVSPDVSPYVEAASKIDASLASDPLFESLLLKFKNLDSWAWDKWGNEYVEKMRGSTDQLVEINKRFALIDAKRWVDETVQSSTKKRGILDGLLRSNDNPQYYEAMLNKSRAELSILRDSILSEKKQIEITLKPLSIHALVLQVMTAQVSGDMEIKISTTRLRTLISAQQSALTFINSCDNTMTIITQQMQTIDQLLDVTIPAWKVASNVAR